MIKNHSAAKNGKFQTDTHRVPASAELPQPVQPGNHDSVSPCRGCVCRSHDLRYNRQRGKQSIVRFPHSGHQHGPLERSERLRERSRKRYLPLQVARFKRKQHHIPDHEKNDTDKMKKIFQHICHSGLDPESILFFVIVPLGMACATRSIATLLAPCGMGTISSSLLSLSR